jgi:hypothetical protein
MASIIGNRYGRLIVESFNHRDGKRYYYKCKCDCGYYKTVLRDSLVGKGTRSCGCLHKETSSINAKSKQLLPGESNFNQLYNAYKTRAEKANLEFTLSKGFFRVIVTMNCFYCDVPPLQVKKVKDQKAPFLYNGIDRTHNLEGYTEGNVVPCCFVCNRAKGTMEYTDFKSWILRLVSRHGVE